MKMNKGSDSSKKLEGIVKAEPLPDVALIIVHVNKEYGSFDCCERPIRKLMEAGIASHVYEHAAYYQSFLKEVLGLDWDNKNKNDPRYANFECKGVNYHIIDNQTNPGNYEVENLNGRRLIIVGGGVDNCHKKASDAAAQHLYNVLKTAKIREIHLPADCIFESEIESDCGESYLDSSITSNYSALGNYVKIMQKAGRSCLASIDRKVVDMDMSIEVPTLHLAVWTSTDDMLSYLRNHERLSLQRSA